MQAAKEWREDKTEFKKKVRWARAAGGRCMTPLAAAAFVAPTQTLLRLFTGASHCPAEPGGVLRLNLVRKTTDTEQSRDGPANHAWEGEPHALSTAGVSVERHPSATAASAEATAALEYVARSTGANKWMGRRKDKLCLGTQRGAAVLPGDAALHTWAGGGERSEWSGVRTQ